MARIEKQLANLGFVGQRLNYCIIASPRLNLVYVDNPKVACTTIKKFLYVSEAVAEGNNSLEKELDERRVSVHQRAKMPIPPFSSLDAKTKTDALVGGFFRFSFVRHPAARALSGYLNKILKKPHSPQRKRLYDEFELDMQQEITFEAFLDYIASQTPESRDAHWTEQTRNLMPNLLSYDLIGRLERFDEDFLQIIERVPVAERTDIKPARNKTNAAERLGEYMTDGAARKIHSIYRSDFEAFDYNLKKFDAS